MGPLHMVWQHVYKILSCCVCRRYTYALHVPGLHPAAASAAPGSPDAGMVLYYSALSFGNLTCLANDTLQEVTAAGPYQPQRVQADANADVIIVFVGSLPLPFLVSIEAVAAGDEVTYSYGAKYWSEWRRLRKRTQIAAAELAFSAADVRPTKP